MRTRYPAIAAAALVALALLLGVFAWAPRSALGGGGPTERFEFGLIGDLPYTEENEAHFPSLIGDLNAAPLAFVVHNGDFTWTRCGDDLFASRLTLFQASSHPLVFLPGDNDWTDCHRASDGSFDPRERLTRLRAMFFPGDQSLGRRTMRLTRQSSDSGYAKFRENVRWTYGGVMFVGLNMPGSNNNLGRTPEMDEEYAERNAANLTWLAQAFDLARSSGSRGIVVIVHANPGFEVAANLRTGYNDFLAALEAETLAFSGPVALLHADTHFFRVDKPLIGTVSRRRVEHFTRIEGFGAPDSHWVRVTVDPEDPNLFRVTPVIVKEHLVDHSVPETGGFATRTGVFEPPRPR